MYLHLNQAASASATKRPSAQRHEEMCDIPKARGAEARRESEVGGPYDRVCRRGGGFAKRETEEKHEAEEQRGNKKEGSARIEANAANACDNERNGAAFRIEGPPVTDSVDTFL